MLPAAEAVPPPDTARPPVVAVKVKCGESGTLVTANVPLYPAPPMLAVVMSWPTTQPWAAAVLAYTIEIRVVELARQVVSGDAVTDGKIFAAKERSGVCEGICSQTTGDGGKRAGRGLLVQNAVGVQDHGAQRGVQRLVRFHVVDRGIAGERTEQRLQSGARRHVAVAVDHVLAIGRDSVR